LERAKIESPLHHALIAKGLIVNSSGKREWLPILIVDYD
jgi:hypothetical protein